MKHFVKILSIITVAIIAAFSFSGCGYSSYYYDYFGTEIYVSVNGSLENELETAIKERLSLLDDTLSLTKENSVISKFNAAESGYGVEFTNDAKALFSLSKELNDFTGGKFNPTVYPLLKLWRLSSDTFDKNVISIVPPTNEEIQSVMPFIALNSICEKDGNFYKTANGVTLDFGGIAKGYAADKIYADLTQAGFTEGYISAGGSSIYVLSVKENLTVKHPRKSNAKILSVNNELIKNSPLSTSGDYERYYTDRDNGEIRYSHIINPLTGRTADSGFCSVTVICSKTAPALLRSAAATDALSTALMLMEKDEFSDFVKQNLSGVTVFGVYDKAGVKQIYTNATAADFTVLDGDYETVLI